MGNYDELDLQVNRGAIDVSGGGALLDTPEFRGENLFDPWSPSLCHPAERKAQFRSLVSLSAAFFGSDHRLVRKLRCADDDVDAAERAFELLDTTPALTRRRLIATVGAITWPGRRR